MKFRKAFWNGVGDGFASPYRFVMSHGTFVSHARHRSAARDHRFYVTLEQATEAVAKAMSESFYKSLGSDIDQCGDDDAHDLQAALQAILDKANEGEGLNSAARHSQEMVLYDRRSTALTTTQ